MHRNSVQNKANGPVESAVRRSTSRASKGLAETDRMPVSNPNLTEIKHAIHDDSQARREAGSPTQRTDGRYCEARRSGNESRHDARNRGVGADCTGRPR